MKTLVLVFTGMTSVFLAESCQGDRTQGQQSVLKIVKSTVEVHSVWHDIYVATKAGGQMRAVVYYSVRLRKSEGPTPRCTNITTIILQRISKTVNEEGLLYLFMQAVGYLGWNMRQLKTVVTSRKKPNSKERSGRTVMRGDGYDPRTPHASE
jgi:hypothetical protein